MAMSDCEFVVVYSTFPDAASAERVAEALVRERLAACVNVHAPTTSVYRWQGKIETATEVGVFIKTRRALVERAIAAAKPLHPYEVPCFLALPAIGGDADYLDWLRAETSLST
jgi:periplasmic divalent cation tolerance protein